jgi:O-antigen/teichoic acid export membrane protein
LGSAGGAREPAKGMSAAGPSELAASTQGAAPAHERALRSDVLLMMGSKLCVLVLGAASTVIVARTLGPADRGSLASVYALMTLLAQLGTFGIVSANPYFAAREPHLRAHVAANSLWLAGLIGPAMAVIGVLFKLVAPGAFADIGWPELAFAMLAVPILLGSLFLQSILLAEGRTVLYTGVGVGTALVTVVLLLAILRPAGGGVLLALVLLVVPQLGALLVYFSALRRHGRLLRRVDRSLLRRMLGYGARAYVVTLIAYMLVRIDLLLVNGIQGASAAGQYSVAAAMADALYLLPASVAVNLFARLARGSVERELSLSVFQLVAVGFLVVCALAALLADPAITLLFGSAYHPAISLFLWLLPGVYCLGALNVIAYHFAAHGMPRELVFVWLPGLLVNLTIDLTLLPGHGTYIASIASTVAYALVLVLHLRLFARDMGGWARLRPTLSGTASLLRLALRRA